MCEPWAHSFNLRKNCRRVSAHFEKEPIQGDGQLACRSNRSANIGFHRVEHGLDIVVPLQALNQSLHLFRLLGRQ